MIPFLLYSIKLSFCLTLFYAGYKLLLSYETFFHFNRKILLTGMLVCMLLPLITIRTETAGIIQQPMIQLEKIMTEEEFPLTFTASNETVISPIPASKQILPVSFAHLLALIFVTGFLINIYILIRSHISLYLLIRSGRKIRRGSNTIVLLDRPVIPFNYGTYIILSEKDYHDCPDIILTHELAHYHFYHSFDIVLTELLILLQWFNPFVRLLKKEIRKVHEFQADSEVLKTGVDTTNYQLLLVKKAVVSGPYTFANNFNNSKLKIRFTMMSKKKSNRWARLKLLLLLPVAALFVYACAQPEMNRQLEQAIRSEDTPISSSNQHFTPEFFEAELNKYISELGGSTSLTTAEKFNFLAEKTNVVNLFVNANDHILFGGEYSTIEQLSFDLTQKLVTDYSNKKPVLINMLLDRGSSDDAINKIYQIAGKSFTDNEELLTLKKQPVLLLLGEAKNYREQTSNAGKSAETPLVSIAFAGNTGKEPRTFNIRNDDVIGYSLDLESSSVSELEEWLKNQKKGDFQYFRISIKASKDTPMGVITDIKQLLRDACQIKDSYTEL